MNDWLASFFDEVEKIASTLPTAGIPRKEGEVATPIVPSTLNPRTVKSSKTVKGNNYTRSHVEAPGTDVTITANQKAAPPPPIRV